MFPFSACPALVTPASRRSIRGPGGFLCGLLLTPGFPVMRPSCFHLARAVPFDHRHQKRGALAKTTQPIGHGGMTLTTAVTCGNSGENAKPESRNGFEFERCSRTCVRDSAPSRWRDHNFASRDRCQGSPMDGLALRLNARQQKRKPAGARFRVGAQLLPSRPLRLAGVANLLPPIISILTATALPTPPGQLFASKKTTPRGVRGRSQRQRLKVP